MTGPLTQDDDEIGRDRFYVVVRAQTGLWPIKPSFDEIHQIAIAAAVWECTGDRAGLIQTDGNPAGSELTARDAAVFMATRKRVYERLHPKTRAGLSGANSRWNDANDIVSFASATAEKLGISARQVRLKMAAGFAARSPARAEDGMIYGPGSTTSDDLLMQGSAGEFVVNATPTCTRALPDGWGRLHVNRSRRAPTTARCSLPGRFTR